MAKSRAKYADRAACKRAGRIWGERVSRNGNMYNVCKRLPVRVMIRRLRRAGVKFGKDASMKRVHVEQRYRNAYGVGDYTKKVHSPHTWARRKHLRRQRRAKA